MSMSTRFFVGLEDEQAVSIYPLLVRGGRGRLWFLIIGGFIIDISSFILIGMGKGVPIVWAGIVLMSAGLFLALLQLTWGAVLTIDEQMFSLRPNPFEKRIDIHWEEIAALRVSGKRRLALEIIPSVAHTEAFLLRQAPSLRKSLARKLERTGRISCLPSLLTPSTEPLPISLFYHIQNSYHQQIQQYHIELRDERG